MSYQYPKIPNTSPVLWYKYIVFTKHNHKLQMMQLLVEALPGFSARLVSKICLFF